jgi:hypothetical protein
MEPLKLIPFGKKPAAIVLWLFWLAFHFYCLSFKVIILRLQL